MKMFVTEDCYAAQDEAGRVAMATDCETVRRFWREPESFLRIAYTMTWQPEWPWRLPHPAECILLWERPDPRYTCYEVGHLLIVANSHGNYAPVHADYQPEVWRDPRAFLMSHAEGGIFWTDQCPDPATEETRYADLISSEGDVLWRVPHAS